MAKSIVARGLMLVVSLCSAVSTMGQAPWQQTGSGTGPSRGGALGNYNLAFTLNGEHCPQFGQPNGIPCDPRWVFSFSNVQYSGTIVATSFAYFCSQVNYRSQLGDEMALCFHATAARCFNRFGCGNGIGYFQLYWNALVELDHIDSNLTLTTLWTINLGNKPLSGQTIPYSGYLNLSPNSTANWCSGGNCTPSCTSVYYVAGYSSDNVSWNYFNSPSYSCAGSPGPIGGFLTAAWNPNAVVSATVNIPYWHATDQYNNIGPELYDSNVNLQGYIPGAWCDTDNGVLSCVSAGGTT